ncbi:Hypothetical predicted protein [Mytilus galloprovincialis]|uniref:Uncharacterized protein n=1 Tax=Mytilus galloprovincialis TaxID=29158 RepID=A0A8B6E8X2_MYTGA|nr:Hypothetical predicted protein [Mytilus galloprovincialis]
MEADMTVSMVHRLKDDECEINGNNIREYSYSEHQTGKSCCESKIAHMRTKMKTFVASGKDMITAKDMKVTIDDGSSVVDCQVSKRIEFHITPGHRDKAGKRHEVSYGQELKRTKNICW